MKGKRLLILGAAFALGLSACANSATMVRKTPLKADSQDLSETFTYESQNGSYLHYSLDKNGGANAPVTNTDIRIYNKNTLTFAANAAYSNSIAITSVEITGKNSKSGNTQTVYYDPVGGTKVTSGSNITWGTTTSSVTRIAEFTGNNLSSVTFYQGGPNNVQISSVVVHFTYTPSDTELSSITVSDNSGKTWYAGDTVLASDLKVIAHYSNDTSSEILNGVGVTITSGANLVAGQNTIAVSYTDSFGTATGSVVINAHAQISLSSISIASAPTKTFYYAGELFDSTGIAITATFSDNSTSDVTNDCTFAPNSALTAEDEEITISYSFKGVTKTINQPITVTNDAADEATFTANVDLGQTSASGTPDSLGKLGYVINGTNAAFATAQYRVYANSEITFSIISGEIGKITLTGSDTDNPISNLSLKAGQPGSFEEGVWTGKAQSVTLAAGKQARIDCIVIEKATNDPLLTVDVSSIELKTNESTGKQVVATVYNVDNPTFVWTSADNKVVVEVVSTLNGVQTVKFIPNSENAVNTSVVLTITGTELSATISVSITIPGPGETEDTAYTVAQARAAIDVDEGITGVYVKGVASEVKGYYSNKYITYFIVDELGDEVSLEVYNGLNKNGASFSSIDQIEVGASVVVFGDLTKYGETYEFAKDNELVSYKAPSHSADYYVEKGSSFAALTAHENKTEGESVTVTKTVNELATEHKWAASSGSTINGCYKSFSLDANINVSTTGEDNCGSVWGADTKDWRLYQNKSGNVILTASNGYKLVSATFTFSNKNNGTLFLGENAVVSGTAVALKASVATFNVGNSGSATDGQVRITSISVTYEKSSLDSLDSVQLRFGASFAEADWNAILEDENLEIEEYGVKLFTSSSSSFASATPVQDAIEAGKTPASVSKAYSTPLEVENGMIKFVSIINIKAESAYGTIFCAAPFVKINGKDYFLDEKQYSVNSLAQELLNNEDYSSLSQDALNVLAGN